jgi:cytochrome c oxidase subunit 1/cytochrome c oxidase subunit I+III
VASRHPLWDDYDEEEDPDNDRVLDQGRLTVITTWLDAEPKAIATIAKDTLTPLVLAIAMFVFFLALVFQMLWLTLAAFIAMFATGCYWLWPREPEIAR